MGRRSRSRERRVRDHRKLRAFELADRLAVAVHRATRLFPADERFGLAAQLRRAAVSAASNIVEGAARETKPEFHRFLRMAYASAREVEYQLDLAARLGYLTLPHADALLPLSRECSIVLRALIRASRI
ncbi:MAG: four helix bundle protein [Planctomycetota bacterium JB042]